jgi:RNA polymerase sigma factor (sigma-70 family)
MAPETHSSLILRVRDPGDAEGWREFVALYEPLLLAYVRGRGLASDDARDVVQEVFAKLLRVLPQFDLDQSRGRFRSWLWQVACHAVADWSRRHQRRARAEGKWGQTRESMIEGGKRDQEAEWLRLHRRRVLQCALEKVRSRALPKRWACFEQHLLLVRPSAEVAAELGITANAVDVNTSRLLAQVRSLCREYLEDLADDSASLPG